MAKTKTPARAGKGKKFCPKCNAIIGASAKSHECGWVRDASANGPTTRKKKASPVDIEKESLRFALRNGGIKAAVEKISKLGADPVMAFAIACGGVEAARRQLEALDNPI